MFDQISVVMITRDAARTLSWSLEMLKPFSEVVIYDNGSTDTTLEIARRYPNVKLHQGRFLGFGETKNHAVSLASNDWIFSIDADERPDEQLLQSIGALSLDNDSVVYEVLRDNYFMGKPVRQGGWGGNWLVRLFNRQQHLFTPAKVHEKIDLGHDTPVVRLKGHLAHRAIEEIGQFLQKIDTYSGLQRESKKRIYPPAVILLRTIWAFFRSYILKAGFLAGWRGLVIAVSNANGVFYKYMKNYARSRP